MKKVIIARSVLHLLGGHETLFSRGSVTAYPARTSEEILNLHGVHRADLIITEADLPLMGGARLCSLLREDEDLKRVSIVMVCDSSPAGTADCAGGQANAVIPKPIDPVLFFSKVSELLVIPRRKEMRVLLRASVKGREQEKSFYAMSRNISISGMLIETDRALRKGDAITCSFSLGHVEITADCIVVRVSLSGARVICGVSFINLNTKELIIIEQFVKAGVKH